MRLLGWKNRANEIHRDAITFGTRKGLTAEPMAANLKHRKKIARLFGRLRILARILLLGDRKMKSYSNLLIVVILVGFSSVGLGQLAPPAAGPTPAADANAVGAPQFPYDAEIAGDNVYIRSGPGSNYYDCGKLNKGDKVKVVSHQFSWSGIVPPPGSFSWIYVPYVSIDPDNPGTGIVTGDDVRVYAGSDLVKPIHSTLQLKLDRGEKVKLLGEQKDNYYKIAAPTGAYLWVSTNLTKPVSTSAGPAPVVRAVEPNEPNDANTTTVAPVTVKDSTVEQKMVKAYEALQKELLAERGKPIDQQDYADIKKSLDEIVKNKDAGKAARYCEFLLKQVERYELAAAVSRELGLQNKQLEATVARIEKARTTRLSQLKDLGRFAVIGKLQTSNIYGTEPELKHYRIVGESGKTICFARPDTAIAGADFSKLIDRKVGLVGTIAPHPQTGGALIKFSEIVEIK
jgi:uncharacterized protein YgiM (DUF1202 family)